MTNDRVVTSHQSASDVTDSHGDGGFALYHACAAGALSFVNFLLQRGADVNRSESYGAGDSCLTLAAGQGHYRIVESLLAAGADTEHKNFYNDTALVISARNGHVKVTDALLKAGARSQATDAEGNTPVMLACMGGHEEVMTSLLRSGADVNSRNADGETALMLACYSGHLEVAQCLLQYGANLETATLSGNMAFKYAVMGCQREIVRYLLEKYDARCDLRNNWAPLIEGCRRGYPDVVQVLLTSYSAELMKQWPIQGGIALMRSDDERIIKMLLNAGLDIDALCPGSYHYKTFLNTAVVTNNDRKTLLLLQLGADPNKVPVLLHACERARRNRAQDKKVALINIVRYLLQYGADVNAVDPEDIEYRAERFPCTPDSKPLLQAAGHVELHAADEDIGCTPLTSLCLDDECCPLLVEELLKCGAKIGANFHRVVLAGHTSCIPLMMKFGAFPSLCPFSHVKFDSERYFLGDFRDAFLSPLAAALMSTRLHIGRYLVSNLFLNHFDIYRIGHCKLVVSYLESKKFEDCLKYLSEMTTKPWSLYALSFVTTSHMMTFDLDTRKKRVVHSGLPGILQRRLLFSEAQDFADSDKRDM